MTWKIVGASKALVLYIYIDYMIYSLINVNKSVHTLPIK